MQYELIETMPEGIDESAMFIEGAVFAANLTTKPLAPESWLTPIFGEPSVELVRAVTEQIHKQHNRILRSEYSLIALAQENGDALADFAEGFMSVWPSIEPEWVEATLNDGAQRMLQAMLTTFMLAIDEAQTQAQMREAGFEQPPMLADLLPQLDLMLTEVALTADELMVGKKAQSVNPFKGIGRNDVCPCGSGRKFKQCCGQ